MKLINIKIKPYIITDDWEIRVYFWRWEIARFRLETLEGIITRII